MPQRIDSPLASEPIHTLEGYDQRHHDADGGFQNIWGNEQDVPFFKALGWAIGHTFSREKQVPATAHLLNPDSLRTPPVGIRVTWLGHATTYVQIGSVRILTDPMFSKWASPVSFAGPKRLAPLPIQIEDLPGVDLVLISHDHYDHLDEESIRELQRQFSPIFLVPLDVGDIVAGWGAQRVRELDWWQWVNVDGLRITCTPAQHFSGRSLTNRDGTLWASWFVEDSTRSVYYAGDTGYSPHFREIRERIGSPDLAIVPIGAYRPRWFMQAVHVDPAEAVQAMLDLEADVMVPIHWGTFVMADDPLAEPPRLLVEHARAAGVSEKVRLLDIGASTELSPP